MADVIYDLNTLPCPTYPLSHPSQKITPTFGGAIKGGIYADVSFLAKTKDQYVLFQEFYDTNVITPFYIDIPLLGEKYKDIIIGGTRVMFAGGYAANSEFLDVWKISAKLKIIGVNTVILDENGTPTNVDLEISDIAGLQSILNDLLTHTHDGGVIS